MPFDTDAKPQPLLSPDTIRRLRAPLAEHFTADAVAAAVGPVGQAALSRSDLTGLDRLTRRPSPTATLIRVFMLGLPVRAVDLSAALTAELAQDLAGAGLLQSEGDGLRATIDLRPYGEADGPDWWVLSDQSSELGQGPLHSDHVLGIGAAATTLAQAVIRRPVVTAADIGTGCGVQALHLTRHCEKIVATDVNFRALRVAATNALLNGVRWELRHGSFLEPIQTERFDLVVCNPPFIVGPGFDTARDGYSYRDSGLAGDEVSAHLVAGIAGILADGGYGQLLANWVVTDEHAWQERVSSWLAGSGCHGWIWQRELVEPAEYVTQWLRDAGDRPHSPTWTARYDEWLDWFAETGVAAVGMGLVSMHKTGSTDPVVICEDLRQQVAQPSGPVIDDWFHRLDWLRDRTDDELLATRFTAAPDLVLTVQSVSGPDGWVPTYSAIDQTGGVRWSLEADAAVAGLIAASSGSVPLGILLDLIGSVGPTLPADAACPVVRDLIQRGFLLPASLL